MTVHTNGPETDLERTYNGITTDSRQTHDISPSKYLCTEKLFVTAINYHLTPTT